MKNNPIAQIGRTVSALTISLLFCINSSAQNENFKWIRNVEQQNVRDYSDGLSAYYENGQWGFIDRSGNVMINPEYDEVGDFSEGLCLVRKETKWGVINKSGKFIHECEYESISGFDSGVAFALKNQLPYYLYDSGKKASLAGSKFV